jgi:hypothetical protein
MSVELAKKGHTRVVLNGKSKLKEVWLYSTKIVEILPSGSILLCTGGHETATTKARMNQASEEFGLGYRVRSKNFEWYVTDDTTKEEGVFEGDDAVLRRY